MSEQSQWMVRTRTNKISGPFEKEELKAKILGAELTPEDEVCAANGYWFTLHEAEELRSQLGVDLPIKNGADDEEATQTATEIIDDEKTDPHHQAPVAAIGAHRPPIEIAGHRMEGQGLWKVVVGVLVAAFLVAVFLALRLSRQSPPS